MLHLDRAGYQYLDHGDIEPHTKTDADKLPIGKGDGALGAPLQRHPGASWSVLFLRTPKTFFNR